MPMIANIYERIENKKADYLHYGFSDSENSALKTFFDLAQEFDSLEDLYLLAVAVPKSFFGLDARLYMINPKTDELKLVVSTREGDVSLQEKPPEHIQPRNNTYITGDHVLILTLRGKRQHIDQLPFKTRANVLGILEIFPFENRTVSEQFFFEKYANRLGFNIHNRFIAQKNFEHLKFIRSLVADIEHNIIVPNMIYKLYLRNLKNTISKGVIIESLMEDCLADGKPDPESLCKVMSEIADVNRNLMTEYENIEKHYKNMSMFLETLLRRSHFDQGRLTLRTRPCNINKEIVQPQLDRFLDRLKDVGIIIDDRFSGIPDEDVISVVDIGLMSQVYANLFSNALKYTEPVITDSGQFQKHMAYGRLTLPDYFGEGMDGIKYNVFTTGPHIPEEERDRIFDDEFRGSNSSASQGTGHGLAFIKNIIEIHSGVVGYEATHNGNNFYFILPATRATAKQ
jgi:signal transduction histidine kinase